MASSLMAVPYISFTLRFIFPEAFFSMCRNASCSPWMSAMKCSVPFGRLRMASRLMISVEAALTFGKLLDNSSSTRRSFCIFSGVYVGDAGDMSIGLWFFRGCLITKVKS